MLKKIVALGAISLVMVACGNKTTSKTDEEKVVISTALWSNPEERDFVVKEVLEPFTKETGIEVDLQSVLDVDGFRRAQLQQETGNVSVDMVITHTGDMPRWIENGFISDISEFADTLTDRTFLPAFDNDTKVGDTTYYLPMAADVYLTLANVEALEYLPEGYEVEELTWEEFANWSNAIREGVGTGKTVATGVPMRALLYQVGAATLSYGGTFPDVTSEGAREAWNLYGQMSDDFITSIKNVDSTVDPMRRGEAWLTVLHNAEAGQVYSTNETQYVLGPAPLGPAGRGSIAGAYGLGLVEGSDNVENTKMVMEYLTRPDIQLMISKGAGGFIPSVQESLDLLGDNPEDEVIKQATAVLETGAVSGTNASLVHDFGALKEVYDRLFDLILQNGHVTDADLEKAGQEINQLRI